MSLDVSASLQQRGRRIRYAAGVAIVAAYVAGSGTARADADVTSAPTVVTLSAAKAGPGDRVKLEASVSFAGGGEVPAGLIQFVDETSHTVLGVTDVAMPWIVVDHLPAGQHVLRAAYCGLVTYFPFVVEPAHSRALVYDEQVRPEVTLSSTQNPSLPGEVVTLTAVVRSSAGIPRGTVRFQDIDVVLADHVRLDSNGVASFTTSALEEGLRRIVAVYEGDSSNRVAVSPRLAQNVGEGGNDRRDLGRARPRMPPSP